MLILLRRRAFVCLSQVCVRDCVHVRACMYPFPYSSSLLSRLFWWHVRGCGCVRVHVHGHVRMKSGTMKLQKLLKRMKALGAFNECVCVGVCVSCNIRGRKSVFPKI